MKRLLVLSVFMCAAVPAHSQQLKPVAGRSYTIEYNPAVSRILQGSNQIWVVYAFDYWGTTTHQLFLGESGDANLFENVLTPDSGRANKAAMKRDGKMWKNEINIPADAALLTYYFTDGVKSDYNDRKTYVSYIYDENGKPVRNARLRNVDFLLMAGKSHQDALEEVQREITDYPDNFLAQIVYWRFQIRFTASPDTLNMLMSKFVSYYDSLRSQYGDTLLYCKAISLADIDYDMMACLNDSISVSKPEVDQLSTDVNTALLKTVLDIPLERRSLRIKQAESMARYMLSVSPEMRYRQQQESMKKMQDMMAEFVGQPAPDFSFVTLTGEKHRLSDFRGKYVLIDFWGSWCGPCVGELPNLVNAWSKYKDKGFVMISVSSDAFMKKWNEAQLADYTKGKGMEWMQVLDDTSRTIDNLYKIQFWPNPFLIDREGKVAQRDSLRGEALDKTLSRLLEK